MSWHRLVKIKAKNNFFIHYTIEAYDNIGLVSTLKKEEDGYLILDFSTPMSSSFEFNTIINCVIKEFAVENRNL